MGQEDSRRTIRVNSATFVRELVIRFGLLVILIILLVQVATVFSQMVSTGKLDKSGALYYKCSIHFLPFARSEIMLNYSGQEIVLFNVSTGTENMLLYSEDLVENITVIGKVETNNQTLLIFWPSEVSEGKDYVISGKFIDFFRYGTKEPVHILVVNDYHEFGPSDDFILKNKYLLLQFDMLLVILVTSCVLVVIGCVVWLNTAETWGNAG